MKDSTTETICLTTTWIITALILLLATGVV